MAVKEVVLISGTSIIGDVSEDGEYYRIKRPFFVAVFPHAENEELELPAGGGTTVTVTMRFLPLTRFSTNPEEIKVKKDYVLCVGDAPDQIRFQYSLMVRGFNAGSGS